MRGERHEVISPTGRAYPIHLWGNMPYMNKKDLSELLRELPERDPPEKTSVCSPSMSVVKRCQAFIREEPTQSNSPSIPEAGSLHDPTSGPPQRVDEPREDEIQGGITRNQACVC